MSAPGASGGPEKGSCHPPGAQAGSTASRSSDMSHASGVLPRVGGGAGPRDSGGVSCFACRRSKKMCEKMIPCARCVRLGLECIPQPRKPGRPVGAYTGIVAHRAAAALAEVARTRSDSMSSASSTVSPMGPSPTLDPRGPTPPAVMIAQPHHHPPLRSGPPPAVSGRDEAAAGLLELLPVAARTLPPPPPPLVPVEATSATSPRAPCPPSSSSERVVPAVEKADTSLLPPKKRRWGGSKDEDDEEKDEAEEKRQAPSPPPPPAPMTGGSAGLKGLMAMEGAAALVALAHSFRAEQRAKTEQGGMSSSSSKPSSPTCRPTECTAPLTSLAQAVIIPPDTNSVGFGDVDALCPHPTVLCGAPERPIGGPDMATVSFDSCCRALTFMRQEGALDQVKVDMARDHVLFAFAMINETYGGRELLRVMAGTPAERAQARLRPAPPTLPPAMPAGRGGPAYGTVPWVLELMSTPQCYAFKAHLSPTGTHVECNSLMEEAVISVPELQLIARQFRTTATHAMAWCLDMEHLDSFFFSQAKALFSKGFAELEQQNLAKLRLRNGQVLRCVCTQRIASNHLGLFMCIRFRPVEDAQPPAPRLFGLWPASPM